jgi:hypothetical protein
VKKAPASPATPQEHEHRLHELRTVHADFKATLGLLRSGYRFDDDEAPAALAQLQKAVNLLEAEISRLRAEWSAG